VPAREIAQLWLFFYKNARDVDAYGMLELVQKIHKETAVAAKISKN
jgi:hypothetical protein